MFKGKCWAPRRWLGLACGIAFMLSSAVSAAPAVKEWTFMVFLNGHNNLDSYSKLDVNEMVAAGKNSQVNVVVQWASSSYGATRRVVITGKAKPTPAKPGYTVVEEMPRVDMGDWHNLQAFVEWAAAKYPAKHYLVDVWDHGGGWKFMGDVKPSPRFSTRGISYDDFSGHDINTPDLAQALRGASKTIGQPIDIYSSDACLMGMAEVADEMTDAVKYFVGSEETEAGDGWNYTTTLGALYANPAMDGREFAADIVTAYLNAYTSSATMSAYDLSKMKAFETAMAGLANTIVLAPAADQEQYRQASTNAMRFAETDNADLVSFLKASPDSSAAQAVMKALSDLMIKAGGVGSLSSASGMAVWLPTQADALQGYEADYRRLQWENNTGWSKALDTLVK